MKTVLSFLILISLSLTLFPGCSRCNSGRSTDGESAHPETVPVDSEAAITPDSAAMAAARIPEAAPGKPKVIEFSATWCGPCKRQKPIYEAAIEKYGKIIDMESVDVDENPALASKYHINSVPTFIFIDSKGKIAGRTNFMNADELEATLDKLAADQL